MTNATSTIETTIETHLAAYNEADPVRRRLLIAEAWAADGELVDPPVDGSGHAGIDQAIATVHDAYPGATFRRTTDLDAHHAFVRYGWEMRGRDGTLVTTGLDVAEVAGDGRLRRVVGFLGELASR